MHFLFWLLIFGILLSGCTERLYKVCGQSACTKPLAHDEAVKAAKVNEAWQGGLRIDVSKE